MKRFFIFLFLVSMSISLLAQCDCSLFHQLLNVAKNEWAAGKYESALNQLAAAREFCAEEGHAVDYQCIAFTEQIKKKYQEASEEAFRADSVARVNRLEALIAYANELAYKCKLALRIGDLNTAFRLAEFGYRYVDANNSNIFEALFEAVYYSSITSNGYLPRRTNLEGHLARIYDVSFSPSGKNITTASSDGTERIWDIRTGNVIRIFELNCSNAAFSPDGKRIACCSRVGISIFDLESAMIVDTLAFRSPEMNIAFSPNGSKLACSSRFDVTVWDSQPLRIEKSLVGHASTVYSVRFSEDGKCMGTASKDTTAKIWDLKSGKVLKTLYGVSQQVLSVAFSPDGNKLATGSWDNSARIWNLEAGTVITIKYPTACVPSVGFSPDGNRLAIGACDSTAKIWELTPDRLISMWRKDAGADGMSETELRDHNLENLLTKKPENVSKLIATNETWQIKAFADLANSQAANSKILEKIELYYERADRLYAAALALQDEILIRQDYAKMLRQWA